MDEFPCIILGHGPFHFFYEDKIEKVTDNPVNNLIMIGMQKRSLAGDDKTRVVTFTIS